MLPEEDLAIATGNMDRKLSEDWACGFWDMLVDRHNTARDINSSQYSVPLSGTEYILCSQMSITTVSPTSAITLSFSHIGQTKYTFSYFNKAPTLLTKSVIKQHECLTIYKKN